MLGNFTAVTPGRTHLRQSCHLQVSQSLPCLDGATACTVALPSDRQPEPEHVDSQVTELSMTLEGVTTDPPSTSPTSVSSPLGPSSLSSSFLSGTGIEGRRTLRSQQTADVTSERPVKPRPRMCQLQQHTSTSLLDNEQHPAQGHETRRQKRRSLSVSPIVQARARWTSPDRFISQRPRLNATPSFRLSNPPSKLRGRELYHRKMDATTDPFRSLSEGRSQQERRRTTNHSYGLRTPIYTPSFVHGEDAGPVNLDPRRGPNPLRHPSWTGFWNIGADGTAHFGQLRGIPTGDGRRLASGTNAPMHTTDFLDDPTPDQLLQSQQSRLALAMDIDLAARLLNASIQAKAAATAEVPQMAWRDGSWMRHYSQKGELVRRRLLPC